MDQHIPVMSLELLSNLNIKKNGIYIDCTFGRGGHSKKILESDPTIKLIALDRDSNVNQYSNELKSEFGDRFEFKNLLFSDIQKAYEGLVDGIIYDIGVSSMQIDNQERGFSFGKSGPLSMEMGLNNISAEDIINDTTQEKLADLIYKYSDEKKSRIIAKKIVEYRQKQRITDTKQLADIIIGAVGKYSDLINPATRTFQAIRIAVNDELNELEKSLKKAIFMLKPEGRVGVITFHSIEDRIAKSIFNFYSGKKNIVFDRNYDNISQEIKNNDFFIKTITKKPLICSKIEKEKNLRARSAKLRVAERLK